jgi:uncharacterized protein YhaN
VKIRDIQIDGFGVWSGLSVHSMPDTMTVFYGPNEAGKTTVMQFLRSMLYGYTSERRTRYLPPVYGGKPGGTIRVTGPGGGYEICRRAQLDQANSVVGALSVTGSDGLAQGPHRLAMLLGQIDESIFTNVFAIGLRELQELSTLDDTAAADELYKLSSGLDRVSLVDVIRQLRTARHNIASENPGEGQLANLMSQREKVKGEIEQLSTSGRRWNELAALRSSQNQELDELKTRIDQWALESRTFEVAIQVRPTWLKRAELKQRMQNLHARMDVPDSAAEKMVEFETELQERQAKLADCKRQRSELRDQAQRLPLRRGIMELAAKIEAAAEQSPWITTIQKAQQRIEAQIEQTKQQLAEEAGRLGMTPEDQQALLADRRLNNMPDLSRQAINQLAEPASDVRMWTSRMKQAADQCELEKRELERLQTELTTALQNRGQSDIHSALTDSAEMMSILKKRIALEEVLKKQISKRDQLDEEVVDSQVDEAFSFERAFGQGVAFVIGAMSVIWGAGRMLGAHWLTGQVGADPNRGLLFVAFGLLGLLVAYVMNALGERNKVGFVEEIEDQLDAVRREIHRTQLERDELDRRLPVHKGDPEMRLRELEDSVRALESLLPQQQNLEAIKQRYQAARKRASQAAESLKSAKATWKRTLQHFGLSETMSPKSIRLMADSYDTLTQTRRRLASLEEELDARQLELGAITQRIDSLYRQVFAAKAASDAIANRESADEFDEVLTTKEKARQFTQQPEKPTIFKATIDSGERALEQLTKLTELLSSQEQYITQKKELREKDQQLAKQAAGIERSIEKVERSHAAFLADLACESDQHLLEQLDAKHRFQKHEEELANLTQRIQEMVSGTVPMDQITRMLDGGGIDELEKRREAIGQRTAQAKQRVDQLHQRQGELTQEMKTLAGQNRLAEAKLELVCIENQIKACAAHWQSLATTTHLLDKVCEVYETERQPETLREASGFLNQLTEGKYVRIWTPLGKNQLRVDNRSGQSLPLEVLSRGTREAVFISLRLSLAAAYSRRGVVVPLVLDDVLVNFDTIRAESAARVLRDFASLGHQVIMFTCHEHIMKIFDKIGVQVRVLPNQGVPGEAEVYHPQYIEETRPAAQPMVVEAAPVIAQPVAVDQPVIEERPNPPYVDEPENEPVEIEPLSEMAKPRPSVRRVVVVEQEPNIDWLWYERTSDSLDWGWVESTERVDERSTPDDLWQRRGPNTTMKAS